MFFEHFMTDSSMQAVYAKMPQMKLQKPCLFLRVKTGSDLVSVNSNIYLARGIAFHRDYK